MNELKQTNMEVVEYEDLHGEKLMLSPEIVQKFITGDAKVTTPEFKFFIELCKARRLNPFLKEAYCIKYGTGAAQIVVSKDVYLQRADGFPDYNGKQSGVIIEDLNTGSTIQREGCYYNKATEALLGAWCKVYRKSRSYPEFMSVSLEEVAQVDSYGKMKSTWSKMPATMCEKVAVVRALRAAFPQEFSQMYIQDEMPDIAPEEETKTEDKQQTAKPVEVQIVASTQQQQQTAQEEPEIQYVCCDCGKPFEEWHGKSKNGGEIHWSVQDVYVMAQKKNTDGKARCKDCREAYETKTKEAEHSDEIQATYANE